MIQKTIDMPDTVISHAPFMISHYDEMSSWCDSPVLNSLVGQTIVLLTAGGLEFCGDVTAISENGIDMSSALKDSGWLTARIGWLDIKHIYYC